MKKAKDIIFEDVEDIIDRIENKLCHLEGRKILITGAAGFIASYLLDTVWMLNKKYFSKKCKVIAYTRRELDSRHRLFYLKNDKNFVFKIVDVSKPFKIEECSDYIIHAASNAAPKKYMADPVNTIETNVRGTETILKYMIKNKTRSFMFFSSGEIYGDPDSAKSVPTKEDYIGRTNHLADRSCYVESKRFSETLCINYFRKYNLPVKIVRPVHIYGPGINLNDGRVWADFIKNAYEGKNITILSDGKATRGFCYISDAIVQIWSVLLSGKDGEVYNIGNDSEEVTIKELADIIAGIFNNKIKVVIENKIPDYLKSSPQRSCPDMTKTLMTFGLKNKVSLKTGLKRTIQWVKMFYQSLK